MAATISLLSPIYYEDGKSGVSAVVGVSNDKNRVARYQFTAPDIGANHVAFELNYAYLGAGSSKAAYRFFIGDSDTSHANAGSDAEYHGTVTFSGSNSKSVMSGEASIILLPGKTYYLWVFPGSTTYSWWGLDTAKTRSLTASGGAGLVSIDTGSEMLQALIYIDDGNELKQAMPHSDDGAAFKLCT